MLYRFSIKNDKVVREELDEKYYYEYEVVNKHGYLYTENDMFTEIDFLKKYVEWATENRKKATALMNKSKANAEYYNLLWQQGMELLDIAEFHKNVDAKLSELDKKLKRRHGTNFLHFGE